MDTLNKKIDLKVRYNLPQKFRGFYVDKDSVSFDSFVDLYKYIKGETVYDYMDETVKKRADEEPLYAYTNENVIWFNPGKEKVHTEPRYAILQLNHKDKNHNLRGASLNLLERNGLKPDCDNYDLVYFKGNGETVFDDDLEKIYTKFNSPLPKPYNYYGNSIMVSDIILISTTGYDFSAYYCDSVGFKLLNDFKLSDIIREEFNYGFDVRKEYDFLNNIDKEGMLSDIASMRLNNLRSEYLDIFDLADSRAEKYIEIDNEMCFKLESWMDSNRKYVLGQSLTDETFFYAQIFDSAEEFKGIYNYEYDHLPSKREVEDDHLNRISEIALDRHEAEYASDGSRNFSHLNDDSPEDMSLEECYTKAMEIAGYIPTETEPDSMATVSFENIYSGEYIGFDGFELVGDFLNNYLLENNFKSETEKQVFNQLINGSAVMPFTVTITETLQKEVCVNARSLDDARDKVEQMYDNSEIILGADDLVDKSFSAKEDFPVINRGKSR